MISFGNIQGMEGVISKSPEGVRSSFANSVVDFLQKPLFRQILKNLKIIIFILTYKSMN